MFKGCQYTVTTLMTFQTIEQIENWFFQSTIEIQFPIFKDSKENGWSITFNIYRKGYWKCKLNKDFILKQIHSSVSPYGYKSEII